MMHGQKNLKFWNLLIINIQNVTLTSTKILYLGLLTLKETS